MKEPGEIIDDAIRRHAGVAKTRDAILSALRAAGWAVVQMEPTMREEE